MPKIIFEPGHLEAEVESGSKVLLAAKKAKAPLRYGCASCRCGTCAVEVTPPSSLSPMRADEEALLKRMNLPVDGTVRLSCQSRIVGDISIDIAYQDTYSPDDGD